MTRYIEGIGEVEDEYPFQTLAELQAETLWVATRTDALTTYTRLLYLARSFQVQRTTKEERRVLAPYYGLVGLILDDARGKIHLTNEEITEKERFLYQLLAKEPLKRRWGTVATLGIPQLMERLQACAREGDKELLLDIHTRLLQQWEDPAYRAMYLSIVQWGTP